MTDEPGFGVERLSTTETPPAAAVSAREQTAEWEATIYKAITQSLLTTHARGYTHEDYDRAHAALVALLAAVEQLREERAEAILTKFEHLYGCRRCVDALRYAGCKCDQPLLGHRPGIGPRCRLCNIEANNPHKAAEAVVEQQTAALEEIVSRHPTAKLGEHPAVDIARAALRDGAEPGTEDRDA